MSIMTSIISKLSGVMVPKSATGSPSTIQILKMLLPMMLPTRISVSLFLAALIVVISSGKEVPSATIVRAITRSETPIDLAMKEAELTTSSAPPTTPVRPIKTSRREMLSLNLGFSTSFLALRFLCAMEIKY